MPYTFDQAKEAQITRQILLLVTFIFQDNAVLRLSTHELSAALGNQYLGNDYLGRVSQYMLDQIQAMTTQGIDVPANVKVSIEDPSRQIYAYDLIHGFRGASIQIVAVFYDALTKEFSSDSFVRFGGRCGQGQYDGQRLLIPATSLVNLQQHKFPEALAQQRCPWLFPITLAQREDGFLNRRSPFRFCAYNPDRGRGNVDPATGLPGTVCDLTSARCKQLGMYKTDSGGHKTGGFGGITFQLPPGTRSREYTSGNWLSLLNDNNFAKYGQPFPEAYGTFWVVPLGMNVFAEANSTRGECVICVGEIHNILEVRVNDTVLPPANTVDGHAIPLAKGGEIMRYSILTIGRRDGGANLDTPYSGNGDPYGNLAALMWVVPHSLASGQPNVQVKAQKGDTPLPTTTNPADADTWPQGFTENLPIIALDLYVRAGYKYESFDLESILACAALADAAVSYDATQVRFHGSPVYQQRQPASQLLPRLLRSFNGQVAPDPITGLYRMFVRGPIGQQQPGQVSGSNYNQAIQSCLIDGTPASGFLAYYFNKANVERQSNKSGFQQVSPENSSLVNSVSISFTDRDSDYAQSSMKVVDSNDINRVGVENNITLEVDGIGSYDHGFRIGGTYLAAQLYGNIRNDSGGTLFLQWTTSFRGLKLSVGQLIGVNPEELFSVAGLNPYPNIPLAAGGGLPGILMRIIKIQPDSNGERVTITAGWHEDAWYRDDWSKQFATTDVSQRRDTLARPPLPWGAYQAQTQPANPPIDHDFYDPSIYYFGMQPDPTQQADNGWTINIDLTGHRPVNSLSPLAPPVLEPLGGTQIGGGLTGDHNAYFAFVCAIDSNGLLTSPSAPCRIDIPGAGANWSATIPVDSWPAGATGYAVFFGRNPTFSAWQFDGTGTPASILVQTWAKETRNMPDSKFNDLLARSWEVSHSGPIGTTVDSVAAGQIVLSSSDTLTNDLTDYDCSLLAKFDNSELPVQNFRITSNDGNALNVNPDPVAAGVAQGDVIVVRARWSVSGKTISDPAWRNALSNSSNGLAPHAEKGNFLVCTAGPGAGYIYTIEDNDETSVTIREDWVVIPTPDTRFIIIYPAQTDEAGTGRTTNSDPLAFFTMTLPTGNFKDRTLWIKVYTRDAAGNESVDILTQGREVFIYGQAASSGNATFRVSR